MKDGSISGMFIITTQLSLPKTSPQSNPQSLTQNFVQKLPGSKNILATSNDIISSIPFAFPVVKAAPSLPGSIIFHFFNF